MVTVVSIETNAISLAICIVMLLNIRSKLGNARKEYHIIFTMTALLMSSFVSFIIFTVFKNFQNSISLGFATFFGTIYYIINASIPTVFFAFIYLKAIKKRSKALTSLLAVPYLLSVILNLSNFLNHSVFTVSAANTVTRGSLYNLNLLFCGFYVLLSAVLLLRYSSKLGQKRAISLLLIEIPPVIGAVIQYTFGGENLVWMCAVLSLLYYYVGSLRDKVDLDYLSGLYNRMQADEYIDYKIKHSTPQKSFSGMMIDINNFKYINDTFGHAEGDRAIERVSQILSHNVTKDDFVARQGGDEFLLILETDDFKRLSAVATRLTYAFERYNKSEKSPYEITISMGYDVYNSKFAVTRKQFLHHIDELMYTDKRNKKVIREAVSR